MSFSFEEHQKQKDEKRMKDYNDPEYAKGISRLFDLVDSGVIQLPERSSKRF